MSKTICVDFDGVLHSYDSGWQGACSIPDPPVEGAFAWLANAVRRFDVCIYSSRSKEPGAIDAMKHWFARHGLHASVLDLLRFPTQKPAAFMTIDDRAICFTGEWPDLDLIDQFKPWNKREFPRGKLNSTDEGQLALKVSSGKGAIRVDFNKPVAWLGLGAAGARELAAMLIKHAELSEN
jgi:hypothetical protein